jgi:hypothetical protein
MSTLISKNGPKDNSRKRGVALEAKQRRQKEAEERQKTYAALPMAEKLARAGVKEKAKLLTKQNQKGAK